MQEEALRRLQWEENVAFIQQHNLRFDAHLETYTVGMNGFIDLSWKEFQEKYLPKKTKFSRLDVRQHYKKLLNVPGKSQDPLASSTFLEPANMPEGYLLDDVDWRKKDMVTRVKDQVGPKTVTKNT
ncbi:unnamed protein product [Protopolystoma xenopodis]|uniref:Cathepsin propeptide inhibitor domain-containing protein n=1 Tax=Protopolystoma xenopodis TaxID=117903 RepID=A0A448XRN9_9PLAT|nr:unnamed protein product [Protopolystoma xenopodis]